MALMVIDHITLIYIFMFEDLIPIIIFLFTFCLYNKFNILDCSEAKATPKDVTEEKENGE